MGDKNHTELVSVELPLPLGAFRHSGTPRNLLRNISKMLGRGYSRGEGVLGLKTCFGHP